MRKRLLSLILAVTMGLSLAACGDSNQGAAKKESGTETGGSGDETAGAGNTEDTLDVCLASEPASLDPALNSAVDGATMILHLFSGLTKWEKDENGTLSIVNDGIKEEERQVNDDGTVTYTYTLRDDVKWSDGEPVKASDYVYAWNRAASPSLAADYSYMFGYIKGYNEMWETGKDDKPKNPDAKLDVEAVDDTTLKVTLYTDVPYWRELLAFPTYMPVREDVAGSDDWATSPDTYICNGPYVMDAWEHDSVIRLSKNEEYYNKDKVTMEHLNFNLSSDPNNMLANFENGAWQLIDDIPTNEIPNVKSKYPTAFYNEGQIGTYYICWNINKEILPKDSTLTGVEAERAREEIRKAISLLIDRQYIIDNIAQGEQVAASSFVPIGVTDADPTQQFFQNAGGKNGYYGYFDASSEAVGDNYNEAIEILSKYYDCEKTDDKFTVKNFPSVVYLYNTSDAHKAIAENIAGYLNQIGITMKLENQEWNTFLETRKSGDYTVARNGWLADFNDPISFLDMWITNSGNNDIQFGKGDHAKLSAYSLDLTDMGYDLNVKDGTWAETYDELIKLINSETDIEKRYSLMHKAEDLLMSTGCVTPIYYYTDLYMLSDDVDGFYSNPLGYKYFMGTSYKGDE